VLPLARDFTKSVILLMSDVIITVCGTVKPPKCPINYWLLIVSANWGIGNKMGRTSVQ